MSYLNALNEKQREAVERKDGPVVVLAGAGSGKTKMLTTRVVHLINQGVLPAQILAVTFTNKAANEMKERVRSLLSQHQVQGASMQWVEPWMGFSSSAPEVSTFHSFCVKLLRAEWEAAGFQKPFVIYDDGDQKTLLRQIVKARGYSGPLAKPKVFQTVINNAKCQAWGPDDLLREQPTLNYIEKITDVYAEYQAELRKADALDFGDLIVKAVELLRNNADVLDRYQERFRYLMVDEYQDTNRAQYLLVSLLAAKYRNLFVVGDEDQSIYKWRGADIQNILDFQSEYPEAYQIKLEQNYRSSKMIIQAASGVINQNTNRYKKELWTANDDGAPVQFVRMRDEREEADHVTFSISKTLENREDVNYHDFAIFYRSHAQSRQLEESLRKYAIPYRIIGGVGFYERKEIKDVMAYMRLIVNPLDSVSLQRIINEPARGIGKTTLSKIESVAMSEKISFFAAIRAIIQEGRDGFSAGIARKLKGFYQLIDLLTQQMPLCSVSELYRKILEHSGYLALLQQDNTEEAKDRIANLEEFNTVIANFEEEAFARGLRPEDGLLAMFLNQVSLETKTIDEIEDPGVGRVSLMTMHSAKGLEFPYAFIVGCEEGVFPSRRAVDDAHWDAEAMEEERRLCYVGMTRAMKQLTMTAAAMRRIYGQTQISPVSRFIQEIPAANLQSVDHAPNEEYSSVRDRWQAGSFGNEAQLSKSKPTNSYSSNSTRYDYDDQYSQPTDISTQVDGQEIGIGNKVKHPVYGEGVVKKLEGNTSDRKITIEFAHRQSKKFHLKYVDLMVME